MATTARTCPNKQPVNALAAWQSVFDYSPDTPYTQQQYLEQWKQTQAFSGLNRARPPVGMPRTNDPHVRLPPSIKDQYTIQSALKSIPNDSEANSRACVRLHGGGPGWDAKMQKEFNEAGRPPSRMQECYSVDRDGMFETAETLAKKAYEKEHKPKVQPGYYMSRKDAIVSNIKNKARFAHEGDELQRLYDYIAVLEAELLKAKGDTKDACA